MKRLSELSHDTILTVYQYPYDTDIRLMSVEEIIEDRYYENEDARFSLAEKEILDFDLSDILSRICEEGYEDMDEDVRDAVFSAPETEPFLRMIKEVFERYPVYYDGATVLNDLREVQE